MIILKIMYPLTRQLRHATFIEYNVVPTYMCNRSKFSKSNTLVKSKRTEVDTNVKLIGKRVKETTKTISYLGVILLGVGITGTLGFAIFRELFSSKSPNNVYNKAVKKCLSDTRVEDKLGLPITAFGEESRRGRRQHVNHILYDKNGKKHLRMKFYLKGSCNKGTVHLEMVENDSGKYDYRYLFIQFDDMLRSTIVLEDNRNNQITTSVATGDSVFEWK